MSNHFDGAFHWDFSPISDRLALLDELTVFYDEDTNLFIEVVSSSLLQRLRFWHMRSPYRTHLTPDILSPRPSTFHIGLTHDGLNERCIARIKEYSGDLGLFWFHGFCDEGHETFSCSRHVSDGLIAELEVKLGIKAEKIHRELKTEREQKEELDRIFDAMERFRDNEFR